MVLPGYLISAEAPAGKGFRPLELRWVGEFDIVLPDGMGCDWDTIGEVPAGPGIYAFTVQDDHKLRVTYVGTTTHLWMVTKGIRSYVPIGGHRPDTAPLRAV